MPRTALPASQIADCTIPIDGTERGYDRVLERASQARLVLIGEASHGTQEFYVERARITRRLIEELGFTGVAIEGDWPDTYRAHRFVKGHVRDRTPEQALEGFRRFPAWMWRNRVMVSFVEWLRSYNERFRRTELAPGLFGLDLYSLHASIQMVLAYLDRVDPAASARARTRYGCFEIFGDDPQAYGHAASLALSRTCEDEVVAQLQDLQRHRASLIEADGFDPEEEYFVAEQNARVIRESERYYREMFLGQVESWNLRDTHMADSLDALLGHLETRVLEPRVVVWAHNSHVGDARATEMERLGELNMGQLVRARHGDDALIVGLSTYEGTVTAAREWGGPAERRELRPALEGSFEQVLHQTGVERFLLDFSEEETRDALRGERILRSVGVVYRRDTERQSHYLRSRLADQFDLLLHFDRTEAVEPVEPSAEWSRGELPETYPFGV